MSRRSRAYYRDVRQRKIRHRKHICEHYYGWDWYTVDGKYSKGKIHCSCPLCSTKSKNRRSRWYPKRNWKPSDERKIEEMKSQEEEYFESDMKLPESEPPQDIDVSSTLDGVSLDGLPLDGSYLEHLIDYDYYLKCLIDSIDF